MGLENLPTVHGPCQKEGLDWTCLWENSRLKRMWSWIQCPLPLRGRCWALRLRFQCMAWRSRWAQVQSSYQFFGLPGWAGKGGLSRHRLHVSASSLDRSLTVWRHRLSATLSLLLTLGICCSVLLLERAAETIPTMSRTFPLDEWHSRAHTHTEAQPHQHGNIHKCVLQHASALTWLLTSTQKTRTHRGT